MSLDQGVGGGSHALWSSEGSDRRTEKSCLKFWINLNWIETATALSTGR